MQIGELSQRSNVPIKTIRYYEEIGVLPKPQRSPSGYRHYDLDAISLLSFIRASQSVGFTLGEIREIIAFRDRGELPCVHVLELLHSHRDNYAKRIVELQLAKSTLEGLVKRADSLQSEDCTPSSVCHLIPRIVTRA